MDFNLTEQQLMMQKLFREVAQNEVKENARMLTKTKDSLRNL